MRNNFKQVSKVKCAECGSENIKKRKNFSHGNTSKAKTSYLCKDCGSSKMTMPQARFARRR